MNFGAKKNFWTKKCFENSKSNISPPPWFSPKNVSRVVIPTENGQTMQFQVLKQLFFSSAPWKTTKKTYISIIRQEKQPRKGVFFSTKMSPGAANQNFAKVCDSGFIFGTIASTIWPNFRKNNGWIKCYEAKSVILGTLGHFGAFLAIKEPLGTQRELFSKIRECYISSHVKL